MKTWNEYKRTIMITNSTQTWRNARSRSRSCQWQRTTGDFQKTASQRQTFNLKQPSSSNILKSILSLILRSKKWSFKGDIGRVLDVTRLRAAYLFINLSKKNIWKSSKRSDKHIIHGECLRRVGDSIVTIGCRYDGSGLVSTKSHMKKRLVSVVEKTGSEEDVS